MQKCNASLAIYTINCKSNGYAHSSPRVYSQTCIFQITMKLIWLAIVGQCCLISFVMGPLYHYRKYTLPCFVSYSVHSTVFRMSIFMVVLACVSGLLNSTGVLHSLCSRKRVKQNKHHPSQPPTVTGSPLSIKLQEIIMSSRNEKQDVLS